MIKNRIVKDNKIIKNFFEKEEVNYCKPVRVGDLWSNNYIEYENYGDKNKTLSIKEYLDEIIPYLKDVINDHKKYDTWKIQSTIAIHFISSKDNDEECAIHSKIDNIEFITYDKADKVLEEYLESLLKRSKIGLET